MARIVTKMVTKIVTKIVRKIVTKIVTKIVKKMMCSFAQSDVGTVHQYSHLLSSRIIACQTFWS